MRLYVVSHNPLNVLLAKAAVRCASDALPNTTGKSKSPQIYDNEPTLKSVDQKAMHLLHPNGLGNGSNTCGNALSIIVDQNAPLKIAM